MESKKDLDKLKEKNNKYGPNERDFLDASEAPIKSYSQEDYVLLPNHVVDPIVANNISNAEFDYTYNEQSDIPDTKE